MPALRSARQRAGDINCASNLRQIATAMSLYATQARGHFPPFEILSTGITSFPDHLDAAGVLDAAVVKHQPSIFFCPEYDLSIYQNNYSQFYVTYSSNIWVSGYRTNTGWVYPGKRRTYIQSPAAVTLLGDGVYQLAGNSYGNHIYPTFSEGFEIGKYHTVPMRYTKTTWLRYAHRDSPLGAFVDGHVEQKPGPWGPLTAP
jgi:hypothetical protein